jgi:hypothetical protein
LGCAFRVVAVVGAVRDGAVVVGATRGLWELVVHDRGGRWDPVVTEGWTYLTVGCVWLRGILIAGPGPAFRAGAGRANCARLEKCGMATDPPPLPGGLARAVRARAMHAVATRAVKVDVFI